MQSYFRSTNRRILMNESNPRNEYAVSVYINLESYRSLCNSCWKVHDDHLFVLFVITHSALSL